MERESNRASTAAEEPREERLPLTALLGASRACRIAAELFDATQQAATARGWSRASVELSWSLRDQRSLHSSERRFVADAVHAMIRGMRRLRALAKGAGASSATGKQLYLIWLADGPGGAAPEVREALREAGVDPEALAARRGELEARIAQAEHGIEGVGEALSYPDWLVAALAADLGPRRAATVLAAQNHRAPLTLRANLLRGTREEAQARLQEEGVRTVPGPLGTASLIVNSHDARINIYGLRAFEEGWVELQDEGSQLIAELCAPPPGGAVIDACAGAGGKTLALGALLGNRGRLLALDIEADKLTELRRRTRRAGLTNVQAVGIGTETGAMRAAARGFPGGAARVLCDVPCSGIGVLRRNPEARWRLSPRDLSELPHKQRRILEEAAPLVAAGGRLIYATCTITRGENDDVVEGFLRDHPEFVLMPAREILSSARAARIGDGERLRLLPGVHPAREEVPAEAGPDGFFAAVLRRVG